LRESFFEVSDGLAKLILNEVDHALGKGDLRAIRGDLCGLLDEYLCFLQWNRIFGHKEGMPCQAHRIRRQQERIIRRKDTRLLE